MKSDFCEDSHVTNRDFASQIHECHNKYVEEIGLPSFAKIDCPHCSAKVEPNGIRSVSLCLNARNIGDIAVEFFCTGCGIMNTVYYRKAVTGMEEFSDCIQNKTIIDIKPVVEEEMHKLGYNNLMEKFIEEIKDEHN